MTRLRGVLPGLLAFGLLSPLASATAAAPMRLLAHASHAQVAPHARIVLSGTLRPARSGIVIQAQVHTAAAVGGWRLVASTRTDAHGRWAVHSAAPATARSLLLRAWAQVGRVRVISNQVRVLVRLPKPTPTVTPSAPPVPTDTASVTAVGAALGPGNRILGADVSYFQHPETTTAPNGLPIDFQAMYAAGVRFVYIKGSDSYDPAHVRAGAWFAIDRQAAQAAGLLTGMYHFAYLPESTDPTVIIADAKAQALKAIWRLSSVGGLSRQDLPPALDLETACIRWNSTGSCVANATPANATLWALTWLSAVAQRTGRTPVIYSFPNFLAGNLLADPALAGYPLWVAQPVGETLAATTQPSSGTGGTCLMTAWTAALGCMLQWSVWQYATASGGGYGVAGGGLDLNVVNGSIDALQALTSPAWTPLTVADLAPANESVTMTTSVQAVGFDTATVVVTVTRADGSSITEGQIHVNVASPVASAIDHATVNTWIVQLRGLTPGWTIPLAFSDPIGEFAPLTANVTDPVAALLQPTSAFVSTS